MHFNLAELNGINGFVLNGVDADDGSGFSVSSAGDINGDGLDDLVIGAYSANYDGNYSGRESYVVFGRASGFKSTFDLSSLDGTNGFTLNSVNAYDRSGSSVSSAGDVNGDGLDDLIVGAYGADSNGNNFTGVSYVVFGSTSGFSSTLELSSLDGTSGFTLNGVDAGDRSGFSVSSAGDVNGDGLDDLIIGAPGAEEPNGNDFVGASYVVFGRASGFSPTLELSSLDGTNGFTLNGSDSVSGRAVSSAGDINGDGLDDLIIGAFKATPNNQYNAGESYVVFGSASGFSPMLELSSLDGTNGFTLNGDAYDISGFSVSNAGDVNGDGLDDLIIGAPGAEPDDKYNAGESYVVFGSASGFSPTLELSSLNGTNGFTLNGVDELDQSGFSVSSAGDVNGDGLGDLLIGAPYAESYEGYGTGESYVVFGRTSGFSSTLELSSLDGTNGFTLKGGDANDRSGGIPASSDDQAGFSVSSAGDVNGDGLDDLLTGAPYAESYAAYDAGESYVVFGATPSSSLEGLSLEASTINATGVTQGSVSTNLRDGIISANFIISNRVDVTGFTDVVGTDFNDSLEGSAEDNQLLGRVGNDTLLGRNGNDQLIGNQGADHLAGGRGHDFLNGNTGNDILNGNGDSDQILGGSGRDLLTGGSGNDRLFGQDGNDRIFGGDQDDFLSGGNNRDTLHGGAGADIFRIEYLAGADVISDFEDGTDLLQLANGNSFNDLSFSGSNISLDRLVIVTLNNVDTSTLTLDDFTSAP